MLEVVRGRGKPGTWGPETADSDSPHTRHSLQSCAQLQLQLQLDHLSHQFETRHRPQGGSVRIAGGLR